MVQTLLAALNVEVAGPAEHGVMRQVAEASASFSLGADGRLAHAAGVVGGEVHSISRLQISYLAQRSA